MVLQDLLSDLFLLYSMVSNLLSVFIFLMDLLLLQAKESHKEKRSFTEGISISRPLLITLVFKVSLRR